MIGYVTARRRRTLSEEDIAGLIELSGGHAGLIKAILSLAWNRGYRSVSGLEPLRLVNEASVCSECRKIWESLPEREQAALCSLAAGELILRKSLFHLNERGLVKGTDNGPVFFSPLFKVFVEEQLPPPTQGTYIDRSIQIVQIAGKRIPGVESLEFEALCCLYEAHGRICTKDDLARSVYHQRYDNRQGVTDQMLHALISRLRRKIEPDPRHPKYVVTVRSEGYKFVMAGEGQ